MKRSVGCPAGHSQGAADERAELERGISVEPVRAVGPVLRLDDCGTAATEVGQAGRGQDGRTLGRRRRPGAKDEGRVTEAAGGVRRR
eukprot:scaffold2529_cov122-Isochrysis_galbana.AAC.2